MHYSVYSPGLHAADILFHLDNDRTRAVLEYLKHKYPQAKITSLWGGHHNLNYKIIHQGKVFAVRTARKVSEDEVRQLDKEITILRLMNGSQTPLLFGTYDV